MLKSPNLNKFGLSDLKKYEYRFLSNYFTLKAILSSSISLSPMG